MAIDGNITLSWSVNGADSIKAIVSKSSTVESGASELAVAGPVTNRLYTLAINISKLQMLVINCTKDATLKTNSSGSPTDTLALKANEPLVWWKNATHALQLTGNVTAMYLTVAATANFDFNVSAVLDS